MRPVGHLQYFRSDVDGKRHPCAVCATDTSDVSKPLVVAVSPGALENLDGAVQLTEEMVGIAAKHHLPSYCAQADGLVLSIRIAVKSTF